MPQCDIIIVDTGVLPLLRFKDTGIEVVPRESVIGIIEVKRRLIKYSLYKNSGQQESGALAHLNKILDILDEKNSVKNDVNLNLFNRHVGKHNYSSNKPLLGVISLQKGDINFRSDVSNLIGQSDSSVDFVWSMDGSAIIPAMKSETDQLFYSHTARPQSGDWKKIHPSLFKNATSEYYSLYVDRNPCWEPLTKEDGLSRATVFSKMVGIISLMLSRVVATPLAEGHINAYYLRD